MNHNLGLWLSRLDPTQFNTRTKVMWNRLEVNAKKKKKCISPVRVTWSGTHQLGAFLSGDYILLGGQFLLPVGRVIITGQRAQACGRATVTANRSSLILYQ